MCRLVLLPSRVAALPDNRIATYRLCVISLIGMSTTCSPSGVLSRIDCSIVAVPGQMTDIYVTMHQRFAIVCVHACNGDGTHLLMTYHPQVGISILQLIFWPRLFFRNPGHLNYSTCPRMRSPITYRFSEDNEAYRFPSQNLQLSL